MRGSWQADEKGSPIATGNPIRPGAFLKPLAGSSEHSITILLPDGQQIMYECFQAVDCDREFRVPDLFGRPAPFAIEMLARIRAALGPQGRKYDESIPIRGIVITAWDKGQAEVAGTVSELPDGLYTYTVVPVGGQKPAQPARTVEKNSASINIPIPEPGLYNLLLANEQKKIHANVLLAAVEPSRTDALRKSFKSAHDLLADWNEDYMGWPIQNFERAYLQSLVLNIPPDYSSAAGRVRKPDSSDRTATPIFSPKPGVFPRDARAAAFSSKFQVTLKCDTPGAEIHYTVDTSQPFRSSPVYAGPITVMGIELTIKAFATSPGKKDSTVVTGIFRIGD